MSVPIMRGLIGHQAGGRGVIVVVVGTTGVAVADVEFAEHFGVAVLAAALLARVEDWHAVDRYANRAIVHCGGCGGNARHQRNFPDIAADKFLRDRHLQIGRHDAVHHDVTSHAARGDFAVVAGAAIDGDRACIRCGGTLNLCAVDRGGASRRRGARVAHIEYGCGKLDALNRVAHNLPFDEACRLREGEGGGQRVHGEGVGFCSRPL